MAKCKAERAGGNLKVHEVISWSRDQDTGYFWRTTQEITTDTDTGTYKKTGKPIKDEFPYQVSTESDHDTTFQYTGINGGNEYMYLKEMKDWQG